MVFHWSLNDTKSLKVTRTLLSIPAVLNNLVVWIVSTRPLISKSSSPFNNPSVTVTRAPIIIGLIVTSMFNSFFSKSPLISRTFFSILANFNTAVVLMVSILLIFRSPSFTKPLFNLKQNVICVFPQLQQTMFAIFNIWSFPHLQWKTIQFLS